MSKKFEATPIRSGAYLQAELASIEADLANWNNKLTGLEEDIKGLSGGFMDIILNAAKLDRLSHRKKLTLLKIKDLRSRQTSLLQAITAIEKHSKAAA